MRTRYRLDLRSTLIKVSYIVVVLLVLFPTLGFASDGSTSIDPPLWSAIPFLLLLLAIALMPFINRTWWEKYYPHVSVLFAIAVTLYYSVALNGAERMLHSGIEYISFICLIGSLFVVAGGMHIHLRGYSTPTRNVILLLIGGFISNLIGTTGASMILIRPYLRNNKYRLHPYHIVFFIFIVSNIGGALTPIGDPPLFLGYLRGVPFFWVLENVWFIWVIAMTAILTLFWIVDEFFFRKVPAQVRDELVERGEKTRLEGMHNWIFIAVIIAAVFINDPPYLREALMIGAAVASYFTTRKSIHERNDFTFHPIREVGFLFIGIFATMVPALDWLELHSASIGITSPGQFYWATGTLSGVLDNAPTYLNFLSASIGLFVSHEFVDAVRTMLASNGAHAASAAADVTRTYQFVAQHHPSLIGTSVVSSQEIQVGYLLVAHPIYIKSISVSAVFFGAMTYIGNGPNFMVKSIAEHAGARVPHFLEYIWKYSLPILLPIFALIWLLFFSHGG